jgi:predicted dehydrogenase
MMSRQRPVRVGLVGAGYIGAIHSAAYRVVRGTFPHNVPPVELVHVADADATRAEATADAWGWGRHGDEWQAVTRADDIDMVDVCAPNHVHAAIAIDAARHGKHVVCEKPLAGDPEEAAAMAEAVRAAGVLAQVCFYYRLWPAVVHARELIDQGAIGRIVHVRGRMLQDYAADPAHTLGWRANADQGGAGALDDLGSHIVDLVRHLAGDMRALIASGRSTVGRDTPAIDLVAALVEFSSGATGTIEAGWAARGHSCDLGFDAIGEDGALRFGWERANELQVMERGCDGFRRVLLSGVHAGASGFIGVPGQQMGYRDAFTVGLAEFLRGLAEGRREVEPSFEDGVQVASVLAAMRQSSTERRWVKTVPQS